MDKGIIAEIGMEGGGVTIFGKQLEQGWTFWTEGSSMDLDENDDEVWHSWSSEPVSDLDLALPKDWPLFYPVQIHPEFLGWFRANYEISRASLPDDQRRSQERHRHPRWTVILGAASVKSAIEFAAPISYDDHRTPGLIPSADCHSDVEAPVVSIEEPVVMVCPNCGQTKQVMVWSSLNADVSPEARVRLLEGKINLFECEACEETFVIDAPLLYHDMSRRFERVFDSRADAWRFFVAGFPYHAGPKLIDRLNVGDLLRLVREHDNPHDTRAVAIYYEDDRIGYVPRSQNHDIAAQLDQGKRLGCRITAINAEEDVYDVLEVEVLSPCQTA
jgi:CpXC protein/HIRAN domain